VTRKFDPTPQQLEAETALRRGDKVIRINAGAGAGKTSTLVHLGTVLDELGLTAAYICYNASTAKEAKGRFPRNVTCSTAHGFATRASIGRDGEPYWHHRLRSRKTGRGFQPARVVAQILGVTEPLFFHKVENVGGLAPEKLATLALRTVRAFCKTADPEITSDHVPHPPFLPEAARPELVERVLPIALEAWEDLRLKNGRRNDPSPTGCLNVEHDHYLKRWQLSGRPIMVRGRGGVEQPAHVVMLDECQDANPVMAAIFKHQATAHGARLVLVGDRNQAINGWNGCVDIMGDFPGSTRIDLRKSFRFGSAVAAEANKWLRLLDSDLRIQGNEAIESVVGPLAADETPDAVLCRTNAGAMKAVLAEQEAGRKVHLVGDGEEIKAIAKAAIDLDDRGRTFHPDLQDFTSWQQVVQFCEAGELGSEDLETSVKLIEENGADEIIAAVDQLVDARQADVTISTAHKAKGLEWDTVQIGDDFRGPRAPEGSDVEEAPGDDESMLAYVAVTRAVRRLATGSLGWIDEWLAKNGMRVEDVRPVVDEEPAPADEAAVVSAVELAEARVAAAADPLSKAVALLRLWEEQLREAPRDDAERAAMVRAIVAAHGGGESAGERLARAV
jgi:hypothetical protein